MLNESHELDFALDEFRRAAVDGPLPCPARSLLLPRASSSTVTFGTRSGVERKRIHRSTPATNRPLPELTGYYNMPLCVLSQKRVPAMKIQPSKSIFQTAVSSGLERQSRTCVHIFNFLSESVFPVMKQAAKQKIFIVRPVVSDLDGGIPVDKLVDGILLVQNLPQISRRIG